MDQILLPIVRAPVFGITRGTALSQISSMLVGWAKEQQRSVSPPNAISYNATISACGKASEWQAGICAAGTASLRFCLDGFCNYGCLFNPFVMRLKEQHQHAGCKVGWSFGNRPVVLAVQDLQNSSRGHAPPAGPPKAI